MKRFLFNFLQNKGFEVTKTGVTDRKSINYRKVFAHFDIDLILDVGANDGLYAEDMRKLWYEKKIISFEPLKKIYAELKNKASHDPEWETMNIALGDKDETTEINVSGNTVSSSLLEMLPEHEKQEPVSKYIGREKIEVKRLDGFYEELLEKTNAQSVYLKLDVQGFEKNVLKGAENSLKKIKLVQLEMALLPLYKDELLMPEMIRFMDNMGYQLYNLIPGFNNFETGQLLQTDGVFARKDLL